MFIDIMADNGFRIIFSIDVSEIQYCGNGAYGKLVWMGEKAHTKAVEIGLSRKELDVLNEVFDRSELDKTFKVKG